MSAEELPHQSQAVVGELRIVDYAAQRFDEVQQSIAGEEAVADDRLQQVQAKLPR